MVKQSVHSMIPKELEQALGSSHGSCFGLAEFASLNLEERNQWNFPNQANPPYSSEGQREWDLLRRTEVYVCSVEVHLQSRP